jgi:hypothetical protein
MIKADIETLEHEIAKLKRELDSLERESKENNNLAQLLDSVNEELEKYQDALQRRQDIAHGISLIFEGFVTVRGAQLKTERVQFAKGNIEVHTLCQMLSYLIVPAIPIETEHFEVKEARDETMQTETNDE